MGITKAALMKDQEAQERIAAAAPDLLAALSELVDLCDFATFECRDIEPYKFEAIQDDAFRRARAAISKALGE